MTEHAQLDAAVSQDDQGYLARCDCYYLLSIDRGIYFMSNVFHRAFQLNDSKLYFRDFPSGPAATAPVAGSLGLIPG